MSTANADEDAVLGARVDHLEPAAVRIAAFEHVVAQLVPRHVGLDPAFRVGLVEAVDLGIAARAEIAELAAMHDGVAEGQARLPDRLEPRQRILELLVGEHELVVPVVDDDARRQRFQHVGEAPARLLGFGLAALHLGHVEDEAGDVAFAAAEFDAMLAHDARSQRRRPARTAPRPHRARRPRAPAARTARTRRPCRRAGNRPPCRPSIDSGDLPNIEQKPR